MLHTDSMLNNNTTTIEELNHEQAQVDFYYMSRDWKQVDTIGFPPVFPSLPFTDWQPAIHSFHTFLHYNCSFEEMKPTFDEELTI